MHPVVWIRIATSANAAWAGIAALLAASLAAGLRDPQLAASRLDVVPPATASGPVGSEAAKLGADESTISTETENQYGQCDCTHVGDAGRSLREAITLRLACEAYSDPDCDKPWAVFANLPTSVIVTRSTGECGGCGALIVGAVVHGDIVNAPAVLGEFGRFGNGPDTVRGIDVAGTPGVIVDWSESMGGFSSDYRTFYWIEDGMIRPGPCFTLAYSNRGAREDVVAWEWEATTRLDEAGAMAIHYRVSHRGRLAPSETPRSLHVPLDRLRAFVDPEADFECTGPMIHSDPEELVPRHLLVE